jgi:hypothetical protein
MYLAVEIMNIAVTAIAMTTEILRSPYILIVVLPTLF